MLTRWITFTAFLAASADPASAANGQRGLTVAPTCRVKGHPEGELTLRCGDEKSTGVVQYWHTPFGQLETSGFLSELDPLFVHHDGSLVVSNASSLHSGLYYCLLQHKEGTTLWPFKLSVSPNSQTDAEHTEQQSCGAFRYRFRRGVGSVEGRQAGVSNVQFAGAVAASVLLTFVLGFSAGALSRSRVLRCLDGITRRLRSPRQNHPQADTSDHGSEVSTTLPNTYSNEALEMEEVTLEEDSVISVTLESTVSSTASSPPAKPQRSFRQKREEEPEATAYLEGCDYVKVEEKQMSVKESEEGCDGEAEEEGQTSASFYLSDKDRGSPSGTEEDESEDQEQRDERESKEENRDSKQEEELEEGNEVEIRRSSDRDGEDSTGSEEEEDNKEGEETEDEEGLKEEADVNDETVSDTMAHSTSEDGEEEPSTSPPSRGRRSRVIRLYQYDEDGQRYGHLPDPKPDEPGPNPRLKQRSLSLTRLNAIMAAASGGPLDTETGKEGKEERPHFHMDI
ncbi:uncharacterized protein LOC117825699 [Notolabrus celidotus]|uniref:uncharacterized protein LOC117825699 n=1 Tax=Notolabrus celidotus TaxID=1203425 RepID=UPI0014906BE8|nr:uncharacterized protein LOC117825699 [Notolabrus celidotus]